MFDISAVGKTENIRVVGSEPSKVFDKAAVKALAGWKYQPQIVDGKATTTYDQVARLPFAIGK